MKNPRGNLFVERLCYPFCLIGTHVTTHVSTCSSKSHTRKSNTSLSSVPPLPTSHTMTTSTLINSTIDTKYTPPQTIHNIIQHHHHEVLNSYTISGTCIERLELVLRLYSPKIIDKNCNRSINSKQQIIIINTASRTSRGIGTKQYQQR